MLGLISETKASGILGNYFDLLYSTGYVKQGMVSKLVVYLFLIDFINSVHPFIDEKDYTEIDRAMSRLFAGGSCLLPYPVFCTNRATLGSADYMGNLVFRITEDGVKRITEDEQLRIV